MRERVLVIGAGPAGLCLSLALSARGLGVDLLERQTASALESPEFDGREVALTHRSIRLLHELGVWRHIPPEAVAPLCRARVMDGDHGGFEVDGLAFGCDRLGVFVSNHEIRAAAWRAVTEHADIRVHDGVEVESLATTVDRAMVRLAGAGELSAPLLVAADSRFSQARRAMGIATRMLDFGKTMLVCRVRHEVANDGTAWEWFGRGQTRALLPLGEHLSSLVLTVSGAEASRLMELSPSAFASEVARRYEGRLGAVELESRRHAYPLVATWARRFIAQRFALVGDAAVGMHPVTAHGFNLGLASVEHLSQSVGEALQRHGDPGHAALLARYERRHRIGSAPMFAGTQAVVGIFTAERLWSGYIRRGLLQLSRAPLARRAMAAAVLANDIIPSSLMVQRLRSAVDVLRPRRRA